MHTVDQTSRLNVAPFGIERADRERYSSPATLTRLASAVHAWRRLLGEDAVDTREGPAVCAMNTLEVDRDIPVLLRPGDVEDVKNIVAVSARYRIPLYPISTGRNWGYGCATPSRDGCAIVDLSHMNRILDFDDALGLVTVEPGVTQGDLAAFLAARGGDYLAPVNGAGPRASVLGNAVERGYGITPHSDHFGAVTSLEAVLPNGSVYRSALCESGGGAVAKAFKWGVGPYVDGLFTQSSFGIVTRATIALARRPERIEAFFCMSRTREDLEGMVAAMREVLGKSAGVCASMNLCNDRRVLSMVSAYPHDRVPEGGVIPDQVVDEMAGSQGISAWTAFGGLYGTRELVKATRRIVRKAFRNCSKRIVFVSPRQSEWACRVVDRIPRLNRSKWARSLRSMNGALRFLAGQPSDMALRLVYWKRREQPACDATMDPARDGCGLMWYAPLVPMRPSSVRRYVEDARRICVKHGMEPLITLTSVNDRCLDSTLPLLFERRDARETRRARACFDELLDTGREQGFMPYRLGITTMNRMPDPSTPVGELAERIKGAIDPDHLFAPGRYDMTGGGARRD